MACRYPVARRRISISASQAAARHGAGRSAGAFRERIPTASRDVAREAAQSSTRELHLYYQKYRRAQFRVNATHSSLQSHGRSYRMRAQAALSSEYFYRRTTAARRPARCLHWFTVRDCCAGKFREGAHETGRARRSREALHRSSLLYRNGTDELHQSLYTPGSGDDCDDGKGLSAHAASAGYRPEGADLFLTGGNRDPERARKLG